jgi:hypothetical protein
LAGKPVASIIVTPDTTRVFRRSQMGIGTEQRSGATASPSPAIHVSREHPTVPDWITQTLKRFGQTTA